MTSEMNRQWRLASRPEGMVEESNFKWVQEPVPELSTDRAVLVRNLYLSIDPTQRGWMAIDTYMPAVPIGDVMRSFAMGRVVQSNDPAFAVGDLVQGLFGWQDYALVETGSAVRPTKVPPGTPLPLAMSACGITGLTAYFGLLDVGRPAPGETVVVSGAAGATGSVVGQIAKIKGCRVVGIAGGREKCDWLTGELGFDAAIDYKSEDVLARLAELCPKGIDIYFDNVGGTILDAALVRLAFKGRVVLCGGISSYSEKEPPPGPRFYLNLIVQRARMEGFLVLDYLGRADEAVKEIAGWVMSGRLKDRVNVTEGLENAPKALRGLFEGANTGKQLVKITDP